MNEVESLSLREYKEIRCPEVLKCFDDNAGSIVRHLIRPCHELPHEWFATMGPERPLRRAGLPIAFLEGRQRSDIPMGAWSGRDR